MQLRDLFIKDATITSSSINYPTSLHVSKKGAISTLPVVVDLRKSFKLLVDGASASSLKNTAASEARRNGCVSFAAFRDTFDGLGLGVSETLCWKLFRAVNKDGR